MFVYGALGETPSILQPQPNCNGRLSVIEVTMIAGVTISAALLILNIWNTARSYR